LESLNRDFDAELCRLAIQCVAKSVKDEREPDFWLTNHRLIQHIRRLEYGRLKESIDWGSVGVGDVYGVARLHYLSEQWATAEKWCQRALRKSEKMYGAEHVWSCRVLKGLGMVYAGQGKPAEAEMMYHRALRGYEKTENVERSSTHILGVLNNLGTVYHGQGKLAEAETMFKQAFEGYAKLLGIECALTLDTGYNLVHIYEDQG
jgi:tetratricopeptide (TPR) repeat protein